MTPTVRHAKPSDATEVYRIARESWHSAYDGILGAETVEEVVEDWYDIESLEASIENATSREDATFLVAEAPDEYEIELVGFVHAGPHTEKENVAELIRIYVSPEAWGDGTGRALLEHVDRELEGSYDRLQLSVLAENEVGVAFYESTGFERVETRESHLGENLEEYVYETAL